MSYSNDKEIWLPVNGYENDYEISNHGRVRSFRNDVRGIVKSAKADKGNYPRVYFKYNGKTKMFLVHRLVAIHFIPNPLNLPQVNHIDGTKDNNHFSNLEWVSQEENQQHARKLGRFPKGCKSMSENSVRKIRQLHSTGNYTLGALARLFSVSERSVSDITRYVTHKDVA